MTKDGDSEQAETEAPKSAHINTSHYNVVLESNFNIEPKNFEKNLCIYVKLLWLCTCILTVKYLVYNYTYGHVYGYYVVC